MTNVPRFASSAQLPEARYVPLVKVASGGMATVFVGTLRGPLGFSQLVAIKRPHEHLLEDESFRHSLLEEARVAAQIRHANVVDVRDIEVVGDSIQLIMDYVEGASMGQLMAVTGRAGKKLSAAVVVRVVLDALAGLSAVHDIADSDGIPLGLVHRDISPQNILVGIDGVTRLTDFGIAMAEYGAYTPTTQGTLKGKVGYMAPEYIRGIRPDQRVDVFAMGVVLWEALAGKRLFKGANDADALDRLLHHDAPKLSSVVPELGDALDDVLARSMAKAPEKRFQTANSFAAALEEAARGLGLIGSPADVAREVRELVGDKLDKRRQDVRAAQAALDVTLSSDELQAVDEDDGTTLKYEPAKPVPVVAKLPPAPSIASAAVAPAVISAASGSFGDRRLAFGLLAALAFTIGLVVFVATSGNQTPMATAPADSVARPAVVVSSSPETPPNPSASAMAASEPTASAAPDVTATAAPTATPAKAVNKSISTPPTTTTNTTTTKTKTRKLPPNPYGT